MTESEQRLAVRLEGLAAADCLDLVGRLRTECSQFEWRYCPPKQQWLAEQGYTSEPSALELTFHEDQRATWFRLKYAKEIQDYEIRRQS